MASATITTHTPITSYSHAKSVDAGHNRSFSTVTGGYEDDASQSIHPPGADSQLPTNFNMSFTMSQGSQNNGSMRQSGSSFKQYAEPNGVQKMGPASEIYSVSWFMMREGLATNPSRLYTPEPTSTKWRSMALLSCAVVTTAG